ncbi:hypothetical protein [Salibacterium halotolerans]|nr:hypothetical protein [Salibacterium halotolerans]
MIQSFFGEKVLGIKTKEGIEYKSFDEGKETILVSASHSKQTVTT